jgi:hypothetical protein
MLTTVEREAVPVAFDVDQLSVVLWPDTRLAGLAESLLTMGAGSLEGKREIDAPQYFFEAK